MKRKNKSVAKKTTGCGCKVWPTSMSYSQFQRVPCIEITCSLHATAPEMLAGIVRDCASADCREFGFGPKNKCWHMELIDKAEGR